MAQLGAIQHGSEMGRFDMGTTFLQAMVQGVVEADAVAIQAQRM